MLHRSLLNAALLCAGLSACATTGPREQQLSAVPSDTPYIMYVGPESPFEELVTTQLSSLNETAAMLAATEPEILAELSAPLRVMVAALAEMDAKLDAEGFRRIGVRIGGPHLIFGEGILPVARLALTSAADFEAAWKRIAQRARLTLEAPRTVGEVSYRTYTEGNLTLVIATASDMLTVALLPGNASEARIVEVAGTAPRDRSFYSENRMDPLTARGFRPESFALIDPVAATELLFSGATGLPDVDEAMTTADAAKCQPDMIRDVAEFGLLMFGYIDGLEPGHAAAAWELSSSLAGRLRRWASDMPGMGPKWVTRPLFAAALNLDMAVAIRDLRALARHWGDSSCGVLSDIASGLGSLEGPQMSLLTGIKGIQFALTGLRPGESFPYGDGWILLRHEDLDTLMGFMPAFFGALGLKFPVPKDLGPSVEMLLPPGAVFLDRLVMSRIGTDLLIGTSRKLAEMAVEQRSSAPREDRAAFVFAFDERGFYDAFEAQGIFLDEDEEDDMTPAQRETLRAGRRGARSPWTAASVTLEPWGMSMRYDVAPSR